MTEASKPRSPAVPKFHSPKQLLTSWLRTNSRKRTHSDSDNKTDHEIESGKSEPSSELTLKVDNTSENVEESLLTSKNNQSQEHGTKDTKENYFSRQKSPTVSPLKKRLCIDNALNSIAHSQESGHAKPNPNPGKENLALDYSNFSSEEATQAKKKDVTKSKETSGTTSNQHITTKSNNQAFTPTRTQNWLTEWSAYCKAKYGVKSILPSENGSESSSTETLVATNNATDEDSSADDLQLLGAQVGICCFSWNVLKSDRWPSSIHSPNECTSFSVINIHVVSFFHSLCMCSHLLSPAHRLIFLIMDMK